MSRGRSLTAALVLLGALAGARPAAADEPAKAPPPPDFGRVDYAKPDRHLEVLPTMGDPARIRTIAAGLLGDTPEDRLASARNWVEANLRYDPNAAYAWRDFDALCAARTYGGCADHALAVGALARAAGVPTVWVKTMDADWIREFRKDPDAEPRSWRGHVFLEVHLDGRWRLFDASAGTVHDDYDPSARILPGSRWAYDKGGDPHALVLSTRWEEWKRQTREHFRDFDVTLLPVGGGRAVGQAAGVYVAADSPPWDWIVARAQSQGVPLASSGNVDAALDAWLGSPRRSGMVVTWIGKRHVLPPRHQRFLRLTQEQVDARLSKGGAFADAGEVDGTRVVVLCAAEQADLKALVERTDFAALLARR